jgi:hypothetical protein
MLSRHIEVLRPANIDQYLTHRTALEFLGRAHNNTLGNHIEGHLLKQQIIIPSDKIKIKSYAKRSIHHGNRDIYILIDIYRQINKTSAREPIGHVTLHLVRSNLNNYVHKGAVHVTNNTNKSKCVRIFITKRNMNITHGLEFILGTEVVHEKKLQPPLNTIIIGILDVLNSYFNPSDPLSITVKIDRDNIPDEIVRYAQIISPPRTSFGGTRKKYPYLRKMKHLTYRRRKSY